MDDDKYRVRQDIKDMLRAKGQTQRDLAKAIGEPPGTVGSRINGFIPFPKELLDRAIAWLRKLPAKNSNQSSTSQRGA